MYCGIHGMDATVNFVLATVLASTFWEMSVHVYLHCFGRQRFIKCISSAGIFQIQ